MGKIINTRVSDYVSVSWSRIMNLLHVLLFWTWLSLTNLQASGSVWNSFQVGGIFFPLTFCSWDSPEQEAEERNITKYVLSPALIFYFHRKRRQKRASGSWPMRVRPQGRPLQEVGKLIRCQFSPKKRNYSRYHPLKCVLCWRRRLTVSYKSPSYSSGITYHHIGLIFSCRPLLRKQACSILLTCLCLWPDHFTFWGFRFFIGKRNTWMWWFPRSLQVPKTKVCKLVWSHASITKIYLNIHLVTCICICTAL